MYSFSEEVELINEPPASTAIFNLLKVIHNSPSLSNNLGNYMRDPTSSGSYIAPYLYCVSLG